MIPRGMLACLAIALLPRLVDALSVESVQTSLRGGVYRVELVARVDAPVESVAAVLTDYAGYRSLDPRIRASDVLPPEHEGEELVRTVVRACAGFFCRNVERVEREYFDLFIGLGRGELMPYGSYYLTGFLHERPLARLRGDLAALGIERAEGEVEPEDHAAILCEIMSGIAAWRFGTPPGADETIFENHLAPWIGRFFTDLERAEGAKFYRSVGTLGRIFIDIETEAFALPS